MKTNDQLLWRRAQVTIPAVDGVVTVDHGLITPLFSDSDMPMNLQTEVLAIPVCFGFMAPANLTGWAQLTSVTNNGDGTFTFRGPVSQTEDITINVFFWLPHTYHGVEDDFSEAPSLTQGIAGQLLVKTLEIGTGPSVVPLSSIFVGAKNKTTSGDISGPSEISRVQVIGIMDGTHTLNAWQGCTIDKDEATNSLLFSNVGQGPILALIMLPHTLIGPVNADNWSGGARLPDGSNNIAPPISPNGQLLVSRERFEIAPQGTSNVASVRQVNQAYDPQGSPQIPESIQVIPLAPLDGWLTGAVGHGNVFGPDNRFPFSNLLVEDPADVNVLFWLIHTLLGPGGADPAVYEVVPPGGDSPQGRITPSTSAKAKSGKSTAKPKSKAA